MRRLIAVGVGLLCGGLAAAGDKPAGQPAGSPPASAPAVSAPAVPQPGAGVSQPLPSVVSSVAPTLPPPGCAAGECAEGCAAGRRRPCLARFWEWITFRPGPRVLPVLTPTPYQTPLRYYFPCNPNGCYASGGCTVGAGYAGGACAGGLRAAAPACGRSGPILGRLGVWGQPKTPATDLMGVPEGYHFATPTPKPYPLAAEPGLMPPAQVQPAGVRPVRYP